jgi:3-hydroxyacyl-CoA dehydrogenase/enoyl-CoA hydratase/3-hydroxybutyryl-CoA epimerase
VFRRIEKCPKPWVAAINGLALGGGLELALACHERVVSNDAGVQLGLPEITLGLLPGAGGTQRLPRLIGTAEAMRMLLLGTAVTAQQAMSLGLVDEIVSPSDLIIAAKRRAENCSHPIAAWDVPGKTFSSDPFDFLDPNAFASITSALSIDQHKLLKYPAYNAILNCVIKAWNLPMDQAIVWEMDCFVDLIRDPVAGNMVRTLFLNRQKASKLGLLAPSSPLAQGHDALLPRIKTAYHEAEAAGCSEDETLLAVAFAAIRSWSEGKVPAPELADVAVVTAGLYPSYTGGPFNYTRQLGLENLLRRAHDAAPKKPMLFEWPANIENFVDSQASAALQ